MTSGLQMDWGLFLQLPGQTACATSLTSDCQTEHGISKQYLSLREAVTSVLSYSAFQSVLTKAPQNQLNRPHTTAK